MTTIIQWLVFRGVGHAQTGVNEVIPELPVVACGRTAWPGLVKYQTGPPRRICEECAAIVGIETVRGGQRIGGAPAPLVQPPPKPSQGSLF